MGVFSGQGPVPDRDASTDEQADRTASRPTRRAPKLALQTPRPLPHRRPGRLDPPSRRPRRSPTRIADQHEDAVVALRKELIDLGVDAGPATIHWHLEQRGLPAPSTATIWRILKARGFVTPQPHKRPKSSYTRFEAELPNERWQADVTHWALADGTDVEILNIIDDHSRLCVESRVFRTVRSTDVVRALHRAARNGATPIRC